MNVTHFLITRFNVHNSQWRATDKNDEPILTDEWMIDRLALFEKYTIPSIQRQARTPAGFQWLLLLDKDTKTCFRKELEKHSIFTPLYLGKNWLLKLRSYVAFNSRSRWIMTTRLDNDDALEPTALKSLQENFKQRRRFLNLLRGSELNLLYDPPTITPKSEMYNHFITYIEPTKSSRTVYSWAHGTRLKREAPVFQLTDRPYWMRVIHERNYLND